ncbi:MAG: hypothetical protein K0S46_528 [Moraxellaceae bacterium]|jgi:hypothetical protein|nr:hypothetical protein [Moraxellaceae bacterium]
MKRIIFASALALSAIPVLAADVGVSLTVGQPGFYGTIDISNYPRPQVVNVEPIIVQPAVVVGRPVYMHVPPGHAKKWSKYCHSYNACGRPVHFVREEWYEGTYVPKYREKHGGKHARSGGKGNGNGKGHGKGNRD